MQSGKAQVKAVGDHTAGRMKNKSELSAGE